VGLAFMKSDSNKDAFVVAQPADRLTVRLLPLTVLALAGFGLCCSRDQHSARVPCAMDP